MTEEEWLKCEDPAPMSEFLKGRADIRKFRLWYTACIRLKDRLAPIGAVLEAEEITIRSIDGTLSEREIESAWRMAAELCGQLDWEAKKTGIGVRLGLNDASNWHWYEELPFQVRLIREIFGNPFRPITLNRSCLTPTVQSLAQAIYDQRSFTQLSILADALEEGGCSQAEVLAHLRSGGEHVRGCWALDLVLGKE